MKLIDEKLLNLVSEQAENNSRLRKNYNLHKTHEDAVQRLLNALEPGTEIPVHRHPAKEETFIVIRGSLRLNLYNESKEITQCIELDPGEGKYGITIPAGIWHNIDVHEKGTIIFEVKEGPFVPIDNKDILE
ncbi:MAG: WbuC family cupin fold metalloprotein [Paludibacter sp.]|nr:WbuC family cupin fold metalloprotein [Paludibacter sp.]